MKTCLLLLSLLLSSVCCAGDKSFSLDEHTWLVDARAKDTSSFVFKSFDELNAAIRQRKADSLTVYIRPWVYWIDDPDDPTVRRGNPPIGMTIKCRKLALVGLGNNPSETVLASQRGQSQGAEGNFTMFDFYCDELAVSNLTFGNYLNADLDYPLNPALSRKKKSNTITQAQLAFLHGKRLVADSCRFVSRLNLCPIINAGENLYRHCHFESTDDALNGNATYEDCDFDFYGSRPLYNTFGRGATFVRCTFNIRHGGAQYFTKQPGTVKAVECRFVGPEDSYVGWSGVVARWLRCYQVGNTFNGKPLFIDGKNPWLSACKADGTYKALGIASGISSHSATLLTAVDSITLDAAAVAADCNSDECKMQKCKNAKKSPLPIRWAVEHGFEDYASLRVNADGSCTVIPTNTTAEEKRFCVLASAGDSLAVEACELTVLPKERPIPKFVGRPKVRIKDGKAMLAYKLDLDGTKDESKVKWYRVTEVPSGGEATVEEVAENGASPLLVYRLRPSDAGSRIEASVYPKSNCSRLSADFENVESRRIKDSDIPNPFVLETDFSDLPELTPLVGEDNWGACRYKPADTNAYDWNQDPPGKLSLSPWYYGQGTGGCRDSVGLLQSYQGARLVYRPQKKDYGNVEMQLDVTPAKTAGQGFSSNRMQYMDICIKYDNATMTGYGLRIIRTLKHGNAVDFQLMKFAGGDAVPVSDAVSSTCYRGNVRISMAFRDGLLTASATTDARPSDPALPNEVSLSATVAPNKYGDFVIQHTGTTGEGQTMLRHLRLSQY